MGNTFGRLFRVTTFGESHGPGIGCVIDGCPPRLPLDVAEIQAELDRRRPGQSDLTTPRQESDRVEVLSGVFEGRTLGTPIALLVPSRDQRSGDYDHLRDTYRPSHADFTYEARYGIRDWRGGGRASARETAARVAAGAVAAVVLRELAGAEVVAWVNQVHTVVAEGVDPLTVTRAAVDRTPVRCPDAGAAARMEEAIRAAKEAGDSVGGVVEAVARNVPAGLGAPVFDRLEADLAHALLSLPATKGFEVGSGFAAAALRGSEHNDAFVRAPDGRITTATNRSGGVQGGISNGAPIVVRVAFKPPATIARRQQTVTTAGAETQLEAKGRHDPCVLPRAVPIVEAMVRLVLADHLLLWRGQCGGPAAS